MTTYDEDYNRPCKRLGRVIYQMHGEPTFWCPGCEQAHRINVNLPSHGMADRGGGERWTWNGDPDKPTFNPSIHIPGKCHSFVRDGVIQFLADSSHRYAGQSVPLPEWQD